MRYLNLLIFVFLLFSIPGDCAAQCSSWTAAGINVKPSECIANGSFSIQLSGTDVPNLSNIKYSIPLTPGGFSVQPNSSPDFANIPAGTYTVKVEAICNSGNVSRTTQITVAGTYVSPALLAVQYRASLNCGSYGQIETNMSGSAFPYTLKILSAPGAYTGPLNFTSSAKYTLLDKLPAGVYSLQAVDSCGTATPPLAVTVNSISSSSISFNLGGYSRDGTGCNKIKVNKPWINMSSNPDLKGYYWADSLFEVALSIDGGITVTPFQKIDHSPFSVTLPAGKTIKDLMGASYIYYMKPPCGSIFQLTGTFSQTNLMLNSIIKCTTGFIEEIYLSGFICYPVTLSIKNTSTNVNYGQYTLNNSGQITTPLLPFGSYSVSYTAADGYTGTGSFGAGAPSGNPYSINIGVNNEGLNGYIPAFRFFNSLGPFANGTTIKLVSGPPGYAYSDTLWWAQSPYYAYGNMGPLTTNNRYFKPGTYVWQIKDSCGSYTVTSTVQQSDVYYYTLDLSNRQQTCNGLKVYPSGTFSHGQYSGPAFTYQILKGQPGYSTTPVAAGVAFTLSAAGTYVIGISANPGYVGIYDTAFPSPYQVTDTIVYNRQPLTVDVNNTQGFLCIGATAGQGQIGIKGLGGAPFTVPQPHYKYYLAAKGNGVSGPYIANNTTGYFSGIGMNAGDSYDLKIVDSCGAFVSHQVKILDLSSAQLAGVDDGEICEGETISLYALPLPAASYSWTGPNGFASNQQKPIISKAGLAAAGQYTVTITTTYCSVPASSSLQVVVNPVPGKASVSVNCIDTIAVLTASNVAGADYQWYKDANPLTGQSAKIYTVTEAGIYTVRTIFPSTGCYSISDTLAFNARPGLLDTAQVKGIKDFLCQDDSVMLTARTQYASTSYQWYKDGVAISGAILGDFSVKDAGNYTVQTSTGPCSYTVSQPFFLQKRIPPASIKVSGDTVLCEGQPLVLTGNKGGGLTYVWKNNGIVVPQATGSTLFVTQTGTYWLEVSNGFCTEATRSVSVVVNKQPIAEIVPSGDVFVCEGDKLELKTLEVSDQYYSWWKDGIVITGETTSSYTPLEQGRYTVIAGNGKCPDDTSAVNFYIVRYPTAEVAIDGPASFCEGLTTRLTTTAQTECVYNWYKNGRQILAAEDIEYVVSNSGSYQVYVSRRTCTSRSKAVSITVNPLPHPPITRRDQVLSTSIYPAYQWYLNAWAITGGNGKQHQLSQPGQYTVQVTDTNGCTGRSDTLNVVSTEEGCIVRLASAFSPNGDGRNDVFRLVALPEYELLDLRIMNRWGHLVYSTKDGTEGWDGTLGGVAQETGTYFYIARYRCNNESQPRMRKGEVSLIR